MRHLILLSLLALAGCTSPSPNNNAAASNPDLDVWVNCVLAAASSLADTSKETADVVGIAAMSICNAESAKYQRTLSPDIYFEVYPKMRSLLRESATGLVVQRRARIAPNPATPQKLPTT